MQKNKQMIMFPNHIMISVHLIYIICSYWVAQLAEMYGCDYEIKAVPVVLMKQ